MNIKINYLFIILLLTIGSCLFSEDITIYKIKFIINDEIYTWIQGEEIPINSTLGNTEPKVLLTYFSWICGDIVDAQDLESELSRTQIRLEESNLFYGVSVSVIPPRKYPNRRTVIIKVTDGFRMRFGGGNAYGMFGIENFKGTGISFIGKAGYKILEFDYSDSTPFKNDIFWGINFGYYFDSFENRVNPYLGIRLTPDLSILIGTKLFDKSIYSQLQFYNTTTFDSLFLLKISFLGFFDSKLKIYGYSKVKLYWKDINLGLRVAAGDRGLSSNLFDNYFDPYNSIRSGYSLSELTSKQYIIFKGQLRYSFPDFFIPPLFNVNTSLFIYSDLGLVDGSFRDAYGGGGSIYFDSPVFTGFTFCYGFNGEGIGRFIFNGTMGF